MSTLPVPPTGVGSGHLGTRPGPSNAMRPEDGRISAGDASEIRTPARSAASVPGVQTRFSPESLRALEGAALEVASDLNGLVQGLGQVGAEVIDTTAQSIDFVAANASSLISAGAETLVKGIDAARSGVNAVADAMEVVVTDSAERAGDAVESAVGYAAIAALAGGALLDELA